LDRPGVRIASSSIDYLNEEGKNGGISMDDFRCHSSGSIVADGVLRSKVYEAGRKNGRSHVCWKEALTYPHLFRLSLSLSTKQWLSDLSGNALADLVPLIAR
jgi:hypothetical protein